MSSSFILSFSSFYFLLCGFASVACIYIHFIYICAYMYLPEEVVGDRSAFEVQLIGYSQCRQCDLFPSSWEENPFFFWLQSKLNRFPDVPQTKIVSERL